MVRRCSVETRRAMKAHPVLAALVLSACSPPRFTAVEPQPAEVRVVVTRAGAQTTAKALAGTEPFELDLAAVFDRGDTLEVWVFGYALAELAAAYPALAGRPASEVALML